MKRVRVNMNRAEEGRQVAGKIQREPLDILSVGEDAVGRPATQLQAVFADL